MFGHIAGPIGCTVEQWGIATSLGQAKDHEPLSERNWIRSRAGTVLGKFALGLQNWNSHLTGALVTAGSHLCASTENMTILRRIDPSGTRCSFDHCSGNDTSYGKVWFTHKDLRGLVDPSFPVTGHF